MKNNWQVLGTKQEAVSDFSFLQMISREIMTNWWIEGVIFARPPKKESYGIVAVFQDPYGNLWDLLEPNDKNKGVIK